MYKTQDDLPHTPAYRKRNVDLYKLIKWKKDARTKWDKDDVIKAARHYLVTGTFKAVERDLNIPTMTVRNWAKKDWWPILLEEINYLRNIETDGQMTTIMEKAMSEVIDRLENGDTVVIKGELVKKPVGARDAALVAAIMFDKRQVHRGDPTQIQQKNFNIDDRLLQLKETFDDLAKRNEEKVVASYDDIEDAELIQIAHEVEEEVEEIREALHGTDG